MIKACLGCNQFGHKAFNCEVLMDATNEEMAQFQLEHKLCIKCARGRHYPKDCKKLVNCGKCESSGHATIFCGLVNANQKSCPDEELGEEETQK